MVGTFGMSDILGPLAYDKQGGGQFLGNGNNPRRSVSDATAQAIDKEVRDLVDDIAKFQNNYRNGIINES